VPNYAVAQQAPAAPAAASPAPDLPPEPMPNYTQPLFLRPTDRDFTKPKGQFPNPFAPYLATTAAPPRTSNSPRLDDLVKNGKIYLSLSDAILLALENNYDIAIQRYNLDIADTDILRSKA
jgi:outer membrane protein